MSARNQPNTGHLKGIRCPKCGSYEPFLIGPIEVKFEVRVTGDFTLESYSLKSIPWDDESDIACKKCRHNGVVADFAYGSDSPCTHRTPRKRATSKRHRNRWLHLAEATSGHTEHAAEGMRLALHLLLEAWEEAPADHPIKIA